MADQNQNKANEGRPRPRLEDAVWVLCASPVTLLVPVGEKQGDVQAQVPLKLERGVNVLAGYVLDATGAPKYVTLDGLSTELQQMPVEERGAAVLKIFEEAKKIYAPMFRAVAGVPARISAVGPIGTLATGEHLGALILGATNGTHRASLEALTHLPVNLVPEHIKELARTRLSAWRPAA